MEATPSENPDARVCEECHAENVPEARFCKACGASMAPPPECPKCGTQVPKDARFCHACGAKMVGPRPAGPANGESEPAPAPAPAAAAEAAPKPSPPADAVRSAAAELPPPKRPSSRIGTNVLLFVAILAMLLVVIYEMNKDAPKEVSPFQGGPPPAMGSAGSGGGGDEPATPPPAAAANADPVRGKVTLGEAVKGSAPPGTLYVIVRNKGVPRPPLAVKKIDDATFPVSFSVGPGDVMMKGMPFTGPFDVDARLDQDGNAMTKDQGDLVMQEGLTDVKPGDEVEIVLDKVL